jgi:hypothetical protein
MRGKPMDLSKIRSAVRMARKFGMNDDEILEVFLENKGPPDHRREIVVEWGKAVGLDSTTALQKARGAALIPSTHPPRALQAGKLPGKVQGNDPE